MAKFLSYHISVMIKFLSCLYLSDDQVSELYRSQWWPSFLVIYISVMIKFLSCLYLSDDQVSELSISQWWPSFWVIYISVMIKFLSCHISVMIKFPFAKLLRIFFERKRKFLLSLGYIFARKKYHFAKFLSCLYPSDDQVSELSIISQWWPSFWVVYLKKMVHKRAKLITLHVQKIHKSSPKKVETLVALPFLGWYMAYGEHFRPRILFRCYEEDKINKSIV